MGLKYNGSLNGLQSTSMTGAGLFVAQRALERQRNDITKPRLALPAVSSIPSGYTVTGIALAFVAGGLAGRLRGDSVEVGGLTATANAGVSAAGNVTLTGNMAGGRPMASNATGSVTVAGDADAIANMAVDVEIGSPPKTVDIRDEIMFTVLSNGQTVAEALSSLQDIKNTAAAVLGLSV